MISNNNNNNPTLILDTSKFINKFQPLKVDLSTDAKIIRSINEVNDSVLENDKGNIVNGNNQEKLSDINSDKLNHNNRIDEFKQIANQILEEAKNSANEIIERATIEANNLLVNAREQGYQEGMEKGRTEAMKRADEYLANISREHEKLLETNNLEQEEYLQALEPAVVDIVCSIFTKITNVLVDDYREVILYMVNNALKDNDSSKEYIIKVSENVYPNIIDKKNSIYGATNPSISIEIFADAKVSDDQCLIETDNGIIDLSLDVQMENLYKALRLLSTI